MVVILFKIFENLKLYPRFINCELLMGIKDQISYTRQFTFTQSPQGMFCIYTILHIQQQNGIKSYKLKQNTGPFRKYMFISLNNSFTWVLQLDHLIKRHSPQHKTMRGLSRRLTLLHVPFLFCFNLSNVQKININMLNTSYIHCTIVKIIQAVQGRV